MIKNRVCFTVRGEFGAQMSFESENTIRRKNMTSDLEMTKMDDEYISRAKTLNLLKRLGSRDYRREKGTIQDAIKMISSAEYTPAADVAEVVRCKDCAKHYIVLGRDMCARNAQGSEGHWIGLSATVPDGFCHRGVHK